MTTNRDLVELLARRAEQEEDGSRRARALRRAARAALLWPEELSTMRERGEPLTSLPRVGLWTAGLLEEWLAAGATAPDPPPLRSGFLTVAEVRPLIARAGSPRLRSDLQMHTTYSDGHGTLREMAEACAAIGYDFIAITDHTQGLKIAGGMTPAGFAEQWREMRTVEQELAAAGSGIRLLRSMEMNLDPEGRGDMPSDVCAACDIVLGAFHSKLRLGDDQTRRYIAAVENPDIDVLAHPRGRIFNVRAGLWCDWDAVLGRAAELDLAVEVDAYPDRQDLDVDLLRRAALAGVRVSIGSDSHHPVDLAAAELGLGAVLGAGVPAERVLNLMSADELLAWRHGRRRAAAPA